MTMITPSYLGETIEYSSLHACRSTLEDPTALTTVADFRQSKFKVSFTIGEGCQAIVGRIDKRTTDGSTGDRVDYRTANGALLLLRLLTRDRYLRPGQARCRQKDGENCQGHAD